MNEQLALMVNGPSEWFENLSRKFKNHGKTWLQQNKSLNSDYCDIFRETIGRHGYFLIFGYVQKPTQKVNYLLHIDQIISQYPQRISPPDNTAPDFDTYDVEQGKCKNQGDYKYVLWLRVVHFEKIAPLAPHQFVSYRRGVALNSRYMKPLHFYVDIPDQFRQPPHQEQSVLSDLQKEYSMKNDPEENLEEESEPAIEAKKIYTATGAPSASADNQEAIIEHSASSPSEVASKKRERSHGIHLSPTAQRLFDALPPNASMAGNLRLRGDLRIGKAEYDAAKTELQRNNLVVLGSGKGGSMRRANTVDMSEADYYKKTAIAQLHSKANGQNGSKANTGKSELETDSSTDELLIEEDTGDDDGCEFEGANNRQIFSDKSDPSVSDLYIRYKEGELVLQPDFQRQFIWDAKKSSRLIESSILEVPLPMIYLAEEPDGRESVIDGQQRLTAFIRYMDGAYSLTGLTVLKELNGCNFSSLEREHQNKIKRCAIRTTTIKKESSENLKFEIFERLNTGAISLNDQELRNCIYRGRYNDLLKELSKDDEFRALIGIKKIERRMRDVELVLRFAALFHASYLNYTSPMHRFLNKDMIKYENINEEDEKELVAAFRNAVQIIKSLFGRHAFRRFYKGNRKNPDGMWEATTFSASIYDVVMYSFARADKQSVYRHLDEIREAFLYRMTADDAFIETIERGTSNKVMITRRFDIWRRQLEEILSASNQKNPRCFPHELKTQLFEQNNTCGICNQRIQTIDDAALDHIEQYWRGGLTIPANARLTHRYCNWERSKND